MKANWENSAARARQVVGFDSSQAAPQYWQTFVRLPDLTQTAKIHARYDLAKGKRSLIRVEFSARLTYPDPTVNSMGFVAAQLGYFNDSSPTAGPDNIGFVPNVGYDSTVVTDAAYEAYQPTALPIGGVDFPIWTQRAIDPLFCLTYLAEAENPAVLWGVGFVQINGSSDSADAATVDLELRWEYAGESDR